MTIYYDGIGDELVNPLNFNEEINFYLDEEKKQLIKLSSKFKVVVEAGCMIGRNCELLLSLGKRYLGIDLVDRYIEGAKREYNNKKNASFVCDDVGNLKKVLELHSILVDENLLLIFPFNSFGNINDAEKTLKELLKTGFNIAIFTYRNDDYTNSIRADYYRKSGFQNLFIENIKGVVRFHNNNGLNSSAYNKEWFDMLDKSSSKSFSSRLFSNIGILYKNF